MAESTPAITALPASKVCMLMYDSIGLRILQRRSLHFGIRISHVFAEKVGVTILYMPAFALTTGFRGAAVKQYLRRLAMFTYIDSLSVSQLCSMFFCLMFQQKVSQLCFLLIAMCIALKKTSGSDLSGECSFSRREMTSVLKATTGCARPGSSFF